MSIVPYRDNIEHLADEFRLLDLRIKQRISIIRRREAKSREITVDPRLYVTHEEVDFLLQEQEINESTDREMTEVQESIRTLQGGIEARVSASTEAGIFLGLPLLAFLFGLSSFEARVVVICLAPELRRKYDKIFVYLQEDITRKKPSIDLVLDLLCRSEAEKWQKRCLFTAHAPLFHHGILHVTDDLQSPSGSSDLAKFLKLSPRILDFILGSNRLDAPLQESGAARLLSPLSEAAPDLFIDPAVTRRVIAIAGEHHAAAQENRKKPLLHFHGPPGVGKQALALEICRHMQTPMLDLDLDLLFAANVDAVSLLRSVSREALLFQAILYIHPIDLLLQGDPLANARLKSIVLHLEEYGLPAILAGEKPWTGGQVFNSAVIHSTHLPVPPAELQQEAWEKALTGRVNGDRDARAAHLANRFRLTPGQINDAVQFAHYHFIAHSGDQQKFLTLENLADACKVQSNRNLAQLAVKTRSKSKWDDLVLAPNKKALLKQICSQVKHRRQVYDRWEFGRKLSYGKGLSVLFSGPPGTGKTMAAGIMARELDLDMYKIDLSRVVSKYIGETEKNLSRIFTEAETSNAILFFDEADALFGKRTEITDSHDRYANIETGYLLQEMEAYEGMVILSTNLRGNMDEAFTRRIRFIVDFPFPGVESRAAIWKTHFPAAAPVSETIDYQFLARKVEVAGGSIRNIVLNAAFLAAENGGAIGMPHILTSVRGEFEKIGKLWDERSFKI
jgi:AAA+ superfamily predicted ATPase